ncbi:MAG: glycosyltransferase family 4 protein [Lachnospiraceae bacterium]|jgi:glycosyltransferase involved in cell wall biosynthesis|nr:glycosyltransferase family 4 protein [Lachnospiraceae bacterium]
MKLYIDMIAFYLQKAGGITSVWKELLIRILRDDSDIILILQKRECSNIYFSQIMSFDPAVIYENGDHVNLNRYLPVRCSLTDGDLFVSTYYRIPKNSNIRQYVLVHDFTYEYYVKGIKRAVHSWQKKTSVKNADVIACVSENTRKDLARFYPWSKEKKRFVLYNGVSACYRPIDGKGYIKELGKYNNCEFLLYVGSRADYKRFDHAVDVAAHFGYSLVIVGGGNLNEKECVYLENRLKENYLHINAISDMILNKVYNKAFALIYPSEYEGFGLPIIEAQRAGCPVIARKGSSIDEVFGDSEYLMQANTLEEAGRIINLLKDPAGRDEYCKRGYRNSQRFDWEKTYTEWIKIIRFEIS